MRLYQFKILCSRCNEIYDAMATVKPTKEENWYINFECELCAMQTRLERFQ